MINYNIGILTTDFINWGGGIDFIRLILNGLYSVNQRENYRVNVFVYIPKQSFFYVALKNKIKKVINKFTTKQRPLQKIIKASLIIDSLKSSNKALNEFYFFSNEIDLKQLVLKHQLNFILPAFRPLPADFPIPWIGYLYDFQHKYYPSFFTNAEIKIRENNFAQMLRKAKTIIVNSQSVKDDIEKFYKNSTSSIITLPFCPVFNSDFYQLQTNIDQYHLPSQYFMISNQFWKHKDHSTAFKAYKLMLNKLNTTNIGLVCTGQTYDERFPTYFNELQKLISELGIEKNVFILGFIPKIDQLQILKNSLGIIQPTLFEGGPGGGAVYESVAYGISSIVSDIPVNLEIQDETVTFFKSGSVEDLANKMITLIKQPKHKHTFDELRTKNEQVLIKFGSTIIKALEEPI